MGGAKPNQNSDGKISIFQARTTKIVLIMDDRREE